jgi:hypothetical protein
MAKVILATKPDGSRVELRDTQLMLRDGTTINLCLTMEAWDSIEEQVAPLTELGDVLSGKKRLRAIGKMIYLLQTPPAAVSEEAIWAGMKPSYVRFATRAIWAAINKGMEMETAADDEDKVVDVVLEEIEKKDSEDA